jgi:putative ABC transport system substrate-binding protein
MAVRMKAFRQGLLQHGFVEGRNVRFEFRHADGRLERLPRLAAELIRLDVNVIIVAGGKATRAVQKATKKIPIVATSDDFLGEGLVASLSRPEGNTTGVSILSAELNVKRLALLKEFVPNVSRVAVLWDPATGTSQLKSIKAAARSLAVQLQILEVRGPDDLAIAFRKAKEQRAEALNVLGSPLLASLQKTIVDLAARNRLPAIYQWSAHVRAGGLMSYGSNLLALFRQTGFLVGRVLKGAKPSQLPVEQPRRLELAVNLKTAKTLGITVPDSILSSADVLIE